MRNILNLLSKIVIATGLVLTFSFAVSSEVFADCTPLYGGGVTCPSRGEISIDKFVANPTTGLFVDNLTEFDPKFAPLQEVTFRILIKNTGDTNIEEVEIKDLMPDFVSFVSGPGEFNQSEGKNGTLTFKIFNLAPNETREYWVRGKAFSDADLPENTICKLPNRAQARASEDRFDEDIAEFCIEKKVLGKGEPTQIKEIPKTGFNPSLVVFSAGTTLLGLGIIIRRKALKIINK